MEFCTCHCILYFFLSWICFELDWSEDIVAMCGNLTKEVIIFTVNLHPCNQTWNGATPTHFILQPNRKLCWTHPCNQTRDGLIPTQKSGMDPTHPIWPPNQTHAKTYMGTYGIFRMSGHPHPSFSGLTCCFSAHSSSMRGGERKWLAFSSLSCRSSLSRVASPTRPLTSHGKPARVWAAPLSYLCASHLCSLRLQMFNSSSSQSTAMGARVWTLPVAAPYVSKP